MSRYVITDDLENFPDDSEYPEEEQIKTRYAIRSFLAKVCKTVKP